MRKGLKSLDIVDRLSVPLFVVTMAGEALILRRTTQKRLPTDMDNADQLALSGDQLPADPLVPLGYEREDTVASLLMLVGNVAFGLATMAVLGRLDARLYKRRVSNVGGKRGSLWLAMLLWDFLYYWDHRFQHEVRLFWANHVSHHSGRRYNLSTALRQPWSGLLLAWIFAPMPLLGFTAKKTFRAGQLNLLYQYWIHTEVIDRLHPKVEAVLNTPSHHRVHHGANRQYLDKNYGGILIIWDRLFGTFEPELRRVKYGLTKNIDTYNPVRIAYHEFSDIAKDVATATTWRQRAHHLFGRPGWTPADRNVA